jgi:thiol:disulfide interchange protein DsbC
MIAIVRAVLFLTLAASAAAAQGATVPEKLAAKFPGVEPDQVRPTPIAGLWEVAVGSQVVYLSEDGRYLLRGDVTDLTTSENLTETRQAGIRETMLDELDESRMIVFSPAEPKHTVTVFTDIDCGYCRKLHREMQDINALGIKVRYLFYPRTGPGSESWKKAEAVWCSADRNDALTRAKAGDDVRAKSCPAEVVAEHYQLGNELGVHGTPAIVTESGEMLPGYVPAARLAAFLDGHDGASSGSP